MCTPSLMPPYISPSHCISVQNGQSRPGALTEDHAWYYTASIVLGLEYMQERNLLWRQVPHSCHHVTTIIASYDILEE